MIVRLAVDKQGGVWYTPDHERDRSPVQFAPDALLGSERLGGRLI
jgi:hypothetical protein